MKKAILYILVAFSFISMQLNGQNVPLDHYEGYYLAQDRYPSAASAMDWFPDDYEVQGVTNDGQNWYFTIVDQDKTKGILWRIPKGVPLDGNVLGNSGVVKKDYSDGDLSEIRDLNAWHYGDPDHYNYNGVDYILVPILNPQIIICFRADNLGYVNFGNLDPTVSPGWCAIGVDGALYVSADDPVALTRYEVDWDKLVNQNNHHPFGNSQLIPLFKSDGTPLFMTDMQGGEFTPSGEMLYLVSGRGKCLGNGAAWSPRDGIHAIETQNWKQVEQSKKDSGQDTYFSYDYDPTCSTCSFYLAQGTHTPEGLTIWDLENGSAPGITGVLHVLVDYFTIGGTGCDDELDFYHYSANVHVDKNNGVDPPSNPLTGTPNKPFKTINAAYDFYPIWDGARMVIQAGVYNDTGTYSKRIQMTSTGGTAVIGQQ